MKLINLFGFQVVYLLKCILEINLDQIINLKIKNLFLIFFQKQKFLKFLILYQNSGKEFINHLFDYYYIQIFLLKKKEQLGKYLQKTNFTNILNEKGNETFSISEISSTI